MAVDESKGWFRVPGIRDAGDRTLAEQLKGLRRVLLEAVGKTVLDLGCAEGLISIEFAKAGAKHVVGLEILEHHLRIARLVGAKHRNVQFVQGDLNLLVEEGPFDWRYDIVLALAVLHKLRNPGAGLRFAARAAEDLLVLRMPSWYDRKGGWLFSKNRSIGVCVPKILSSEGFRLEGDVDGPRGERVLLWRRKDGLGR